MHLSDLGLLLNLGEVKWVTQARATKSTDLAAAMRLGGMRVEYRERHKELRPQTEPPKASRVPIASRPAPPAPPTAPPAPPAPPTAPPLRPVTVFEVQAAVEAGLALATPALLATMYAELVTLAGRQVTPADIAAMEKRINAAIAAIPTTAAVGAPTAVAAAPAAPAHAHEPEPEPVFVPTTVMPDNPTQVRATAASQAGGALGEAATALKATKTKTRRRRKKAE